MLKRLYPYRFEIFLLSQMIIIFNSIIFAGDIFAGWIGPLSFQINFVSALILLSRKKKINGFFRLYDHYNDFFTRDNIFTEI